MRSLIISSMIAGLALAANAQEVPKLTAEQAAAMVREHAQSKNQTSTGKNSGEVFGSATRCCKGQF